MAYRRADQNTRVNKALTNLSIERGQGMTPVARRIFPTYPVDSDMWIGEYYKFKKKQFKAPGLPKVSRGDTAKATPMPQWDADLDTYRCQDEAMEATTPVKRQQQVDRIFDLRNTNIMRTEATLRLVEEKAVYDVVGTSGTYPTGNFKSGHATTNDATNFIYFDATNGDAIKTLRRLRFQIGRLTGNLPNTIVVSPDVVEQFVLDAKITERIKYVATAMADIALISKLTGIPESGIVIPDYSIDAAAVGKDESIDYLWKNKIWLGYVAPAFGLGIQTFGITFSEKIGGASAEGYNIREYFKDEEGRGTWHDIVEQSIDRKLVLGACGGFLNNCYQNSLD